VIADRTGWSLDSWMRWWQAHGRSTSVYVAHITVTQTRRYRTDGRSRNVGLIVCRTALAVAVLTMIVHARLNILQSPLRRGSDNKPEVAMVNGERVWHYLSLHRGMVVSPPMFCGFKCNFVPCKRQVSSSIHQLFCLISGLFLIYWTIGIYTNWMT